MNREEAEFTPKGVLHEDCEDNIEDFISRAASRVETMLEAPEEEWQDLEVNWVRAALERSQTLDELGVALSWSVVHADASGHTGFSQTLLDIFAEATKPGRYPLPLPLGDLHEFVEFLESFSCLAGISQEVLAAKAEDGWLFLTILGVNALHSSAKIPEKLAWQAHHRRAVENLRGHIQRFRKSAGAVERKVDCEEIEKELKAKRVNYSGEELLLCHPLSLRQILPALPPVEHGGCVDALDWVGDVTSHFLERPDLMVIEDVGQELPRLQGKINIVPEDLDAVVGELCKRNVCSWVPLCDVLHYRGQPVLNGMFGVEKPSKLADNSPVLRVIMNLIPSNSIPRQLTGGTSSLPYITQWLSTVLEDQQEVRFWQSDMSSAFYLFSLPKAWWGHLSFNILRYGHQIGLPSNQVFALCCKVIPMGFNSSVSVMQEISENLLKHTLSSSSRLTRGRQLPSWLTGVLEQGAGSHRAWFHVYLDNFCSAARVEPPETGDQGRDFHNLAEKAWSRAGVVSSAKKRKCDLRQAEELGSFIDGENRTMGISGERQLKLCQTTLHLCCRGPLNRKMTQVVAGRWVHCFQFRRPLMSCLDVVWAYIGQSKTRKFSYNEVRRELVRAVCLLPLAHTHLGAKVDNCVSASDASNTGGAIGLSRMPSLEGRDFVGASKEAELKVKEIPVLVISLFNGIGGALRCYDILGLRPMGIIICDNCKEANRVSMRRWPAAELIEDVKHIDRDLVRAWCLKHTRVTEIHLWAGFPCKDLSSARHGRWNLDGDASSLFYEVPRVKKLLVEEFPSKCKVKFVLENVASMDREAAEEISFEIGTVPYHLDVADSMPIHRPRLCWTSEDWEGLMEGVELTREQYWIRVLAPHEWPSLDQWITPGWHWEGHRSNVILPTAMRTVPKTHPPPHPAGLDRASEASRQRWRADNFRLPPYQYHEKFIFTHAESGRWRRPNASEKELLMGYGWGHTELCMSASEIKKSKIHYEDTRQSLIGDSFAIGSFVIAAAGLCRSFHQVKHYRDLWKRLGLAPGFCSEPSGVAPLARKLVYGSFRLAPNEPHLLNRLLLSRVNHTGSDVRVSTGAIVNPKSYPRQGAESDWWSWIPVFHTRWNCSEHINILELRSIFLTIKHHVTHLRSSDCRIFHLSDSYVCISIVAKGRTSSLRLQRVLRQLNSYLLAFGIVLILCHVESTKNPTDHASRST